MTSAVQTNGIDMPDGWVRVEDRWFGLDKRSIAPALIVLIFAILIAGVAPAINDGVAYHDKVVAGDVMELSGGVTFEPAAGWGITTGVRQSASIVSYPAVATVVSSGYAFTIRTAPFTSDSEALLKVIRKTNNKLVSGGGLRVDGQAQSLTTASGLDGVAARFSSAKSDGAIAAFVSDGLGIEVIVTGPPGDVAEQPAQDIAAMLNSIAISPKGATK